ncbi:MAG: NUDIX domain-containing protein [Patescibacteria group bacterium]
MKELSHFCVTDVFLENEFEEVLMLKRSKKKKILPNLYNGLGGKIDNGETPLQAIQREAKEEAGVISMENLQYRANLSVKDKFGFWQIYIFYGNVYKKNIIIKEVDEGTLEWIPKNKLLDYQLVPDLNNWLPKMFANPEAFQFVKIEYDDKYNLKKIMITPLT